MKHPVPKAISNALAGYPDDVEVLALRARDLVLNTLPGASEELDTTGKLIGYGLGPGYTGTVCTLIMSKKGVKIGIVRGATLPDPHGLMGGAGSVHRHVDVRTLADLAQPGLKPLLKTALAAWKERNQRVENKPRAGALPRAPRPGARRVPR